MSAFCASCANCRGQKVFVRSGIRYDYLNADPNPTFLQELVQHHISGQPKVAPEHCVNHVLDKMGKPHIQDFDRFCKRFYEETKRIGKEQYLVPYLMSSHRAAPSPTRWSWRST